MDKHGAHSSLMRGVQDPFAYTVLVARHRRVKLTFELSFLRRASRWSAPSAKPRRRVGGSPTGSMRANQSAKCATTDRYATRVDPTRQYFIIFVSSQLTLIPAVLLFTARCQPWKVLQMRYGWEKYKRNAKVEAQEGRVVLQAV